MDLYNTHFELKAAHTDIAILPVGSIEQHTHHLPLGTDSIIAWHVSRLISAALEKEGHPNYLLPPQPFGTSLEHKGFKGTATLRPPTLGLVIKDLVDCLYEHGFKYVLLLSFHGGNFVLKPTVREINYDNPGRKVILMEGWGIIPEAELAAIVETPDLHSGESETSIMLAIDESYVRDKRVDFIPDAPRPALDMYSFKKLTPEGVWGIPSKATKEKGEKLIALKVKYATAYLTDWLKQAADDSEY